MVLDVELKITEANITELNHVMNQAGFDCWAWDYDHATYDYKYEDKKSNHTYYLRVVAHAVQGRLDDNDTTVRLGEAHIGKHLFPHGLDYEAVIPKAIVEAAKQKLNSVKEKLA
jgi:hypothetical protein